MLLSMTGFGSAVAECANKKFTVEIKSLNSKQLDLSMRSPAGYRLIEPEMRAMVAAQLERGKVELSLSVETVGGEGAVELNVPALEAYCRQIREASAALGIPEPQDWYSVLMRFPDAVKSDSSDELSGDERRVLLETLSNALDHILEHRAAEGRKLDEFFRVRVGRIRDLLAEVPRYETERVAKIRARMQDALSSLHQVEYDKGRFEQEMIFYIEKLDINEEKQRLTQHLDYFLQTLDGKPGQGKKLGFIAQEMG
ncbi:MAG: DUF1732 domain-containing protein, partial [Muribaculaceae bacterium]|nr:DUF1732 domain-containing protein [Muribaculaceae bacterium]